MRVWGFGVAALACAAAWFGCSSFDSAEEAARAAAAQKEAGAAGLAPVTGTALGNYDMTVDLTTVRHGQPAVAKLAVTRHPPFDRVLRVDLKDPPAGVTAEPIELATNATSGELSIKADATVPQGNLTLHIRANAPQTTLLDLVLPKDVAVQGAPGELDTSFGNQGALETLSLGTISPLADGTFFEFGVGTAIRYKGDGSGVDTSFADAGTRPIASGTEGHVAVGSNLIYDVHNRRIVTGPTVNVFRYLLNGEPDPVSARYVNIDQLVSSIALDEKGSLATLGRSNGGLGWVVLWLDPSGKPDSAVNATGESSGPNPSDIVAGAYGNDAVYAVGSDNTVFRLPKAGGALDPSFGSAGFVSFPQGPVIRAAVIDAAGRVVVGGLGGAGVYMGRIANGKLDSTFATQGFTSYGPNVVSGGKVVLQADNRILQIANVMDGNGAHCAVVRRLESGELDPTFGQNGVSILPAPDCSAVDLAVTRSNELLLAGFTRTFRIWL